MTYRKFQKVIWDHYENHARPMPWRNINDPYKIFVSEIMLQQTQVSRVLEKYPLFIKRFPSWIALSKASTKEVLEEWIGLGYNRRGLNLKKSAEIIMKDFAGKLPSTEEDLLKLPGIGPATTGSLQAFVFNQPVVFIETNIRSVYIHHFFKDRDDVADNELIPYIQKTVDKENPREWYYALMDYGTELKKSVGNASKKSRHYTKQSKFEGSNRQIRAKIIKELVVRPQQTKRSLIKKISDERVEQNLINLDKEGLISKEKSRYSISK